MKPTLLLLTLFLLLVPRCLGVEPEAEPEAELAVPQFFMEDLDACMLRNALQELPEQGSPQAHKLGGYIFSFASGRLAFDPLSLEDKEPSSFVEFRAAVTVADAGDIYFRSVGRHAFLVALSGKIASLGEHLLQDFDSLFMEDPQETVYSGDEGENLVGVLPGIQAGHCYLMTTTDNRTILLRVASKSLDGRSITIQWVEQGPRGRTFEIPKAPVIELQQARKYEGVIPAEAFRVPDDIVRKIGALSVFKDTRAAIRRKPIDEEHEVLLISIGFKRGVIAQFQKELRASGWLPKGTRPSKVHPRLVEHVLTRGGKELVCRYAASAGSYMIHLTLEK